MMMRGWVTGLGVALAAVMVLQAAPVSADKGDVGRVADFHVGRTGVVGQQLRVELGARVEAGARQALSAPPRIELQRAIIIREELPH